MRVIFWAVWLVSCASQNSGGQAVRADSTTAQTVKDEGGWTADLIFGLPTEKEGAPVEAPPVSGHSTDAARSAGLPSILTDPDAFLNNLPFDHGPLIGVRLSGKLPVTTTTAGTTHIDESSWFKRAWKFSLGIWPWLLGGGLALAISILKPAWLGIAWGALKGLFGRKVS